MSTSRSFTEYVFSRFYNDFFSAVKEYVDDNFSDIDLHSNSVANIDSAALVDIEVNFDYFI